MIFKIIVSRNINTNKNWVQTGVMHGNKIL